MMKLSISQGRVAWLLACLLAPLSSASATTYHFTISRQEDGGEVWSTTGKVWASGEKFRIQYDEQQVFGNDALVSAGKDDPTFALSSASKTYFDWWAYISEHGGLPRTKSGLLDLTIDFKKTDGEKEVAGWPAQQHDLRISYTIETDYGVEVVKERVTVDFSLWTTSGVAYAEPPEMVNPRRLWLEELFGPQSGGVKTGKQWGEAEQKVKDTLAAIGGFPLKSRQKLTRQFVGGPPRVTLWTFLLDHFEDTDAPASTFNLPEGYRESKPRIGFPGHHPG